MRFLIDAQLPPALCGWFEERGFEAEHVSQRLGGQTPDVKIAAYAAEGGFVLVTKDDDFALRHLPDRYRLLWLRCGNITNRALRVWLLER
jgi:predicted nuclease of predicted toxin-antitoxin system